MTVHGKFTDRELQEMALEACFQITGESVKDQCRHQGDTAYQIIMYYFEKINDR